MPTSGCSHVRPRAATIAVLALYAAALLFWWMQNTLHLVGGAVALQKALWLATALILWLILPMFIALDSRLHGFVRSAFALLLTLMAARGMAELPMLYLWHNWSPWYGITHDAACMLALAWAYLRVAMTPVNGKPLWLTHIGATFAAFVPEIYFAWYMQAHFHNQGGNAIYYVPDDPAHVLALNITTTAVVCFGAWIFLFLYRWGRVATDRVR